MGVIKSAYQIAMENSKDIEANKELVETNRLRDEGKKLVSKLLDEASFDLKAALKAYEKEPLASVREGLIQSLLANLVLPGRRVLPEEQQEDRGRVRRHRLRRPQGEHDLQPAGELLQRVPRGAQAPGGGGGAPVRARSRRKRKRSFPARWVGR